MPSGCCTGNGIDQVVDDFEVDEDEEEDDDEETTGNDEDMEQDELQELIDNAVTRGTKLKHRMRHFVTVLQNGKSISEWKCRFGNDDCRHKLAIAWYVGNTIKFVRTFACVPCKHKK